LTTSSAPPATAPPPSLRLTSPCWLPNPLNAFNVGSTGNNNTNASYIAAYTNNLPAGAIVPTWDLKSVTLNSSRNPVFTFAFKQNGTIVPLRTYAAGTVDTFWANFVGGPSFYIAMGLAQDGVAVPADWNVTNSIYFPMPGRGDGKAADGSALTANAATTLSGPDSTGYYTLTMTGCAVPLTATMVTGGIGYTYGLKTTAPLVQTNVVGYTYVPLVWTGVGTWTNGTGQGGLAVPAPNVTKLVSGTLPTGMVAQASSSRHRDDGQVQRLPRRPGHLHGEDLPRRPAQRCTDLHLLPQREPRQQRLGRQHQGSRPRHPRQRQARQQVLVGSLRGRLLLAGGVPRHP
jgi:hypothetical protein